MSLGSDKKNKFFYQTVVDICPLDPDQQKYTVQRIRTQGRKYQKNKKLQLMLDF